MPLRGGEPMQLPPNGPVEWALQVWLWMMMVMIAGFLVAMALHCGFAP